MRNENKFVYENEFFAKTIKFKNHKCVVFFSPIKLAFNKSSRFLFRMKEKMFKRIRELKT